MFISVPELPERPLKAYHFFGKNCKGGKPFYRFKRSGRTAQNFLRPNYKGAEKMEVQKPIYSVFGRSHGAKENRDRGSIFPK